jgi:hypothetical protein
VRREKTEGRSVNDATLYSHDTSHSVMKEIMIIIHKKLYGGIFILCYFIAKHKIFLRNLLGKPIILKVSDINFEHRLLILFQKYL